MPESMPYQTYRNLPPLAGLCSIDEAIEDGLTVDECVSRLKRYHYVLRRLHEVFSKRITSEPIYELKMAFSYHAHLCAEHVAHVAGRVAEMREPPLGLDRIPDPYLEIFFDEILAAPTTETLVAGLYGKAIPALQAALRRHIHETNKVFDAPTVRLARFALLELDEMATFGKQAVASLIDDDIEHSMMPWSGLLDQCLAAAGGVDGASDPNAVEVARQFSADGYEYNNIPTRDERFIDPFNMAVNAEAFLYKDSYPPKPKLLMLYWKRICEIGVPEMMASIIAEREDKPWDYYQDMTRQLWDEARHALMGEIGFASLGIDWTEIPLLIAFAHQLNTQVEALERHAVLYFIEQGLMPKHGKRFEWEIAQEAGSRLAMLMQDYDWADEVLHAHIGREHFVSEIGSMREAIELGDRSWNSVMLDYHAWEEKGLTQHRNWWPDLYRAACQVWGEEPDPAVLAFDETYENTRADLKEVSGPA